MIGFGHHRYSWKEYREARLNRNDDIAFVWLDRIRSIRVAQHERRAHIPRVPRVEQAEDNEQASYCAADDHRRDLGASNLDAVFREHGGAV